MRVLRNCAGILGTRSDAGRSSRIHADRGVRQAGVHGRQWRGRRPPIHPQIEKRITRHSAKVTSESGSVPSYLLWGIPAAPYAIFHYGVVVERNRREGGVVARTSGRNLMP